MEVIKQKNDKLDVYDFYLIEDNKVLSIIFGGNLDLYLNLNQVNSKENIDTIHTKELTETFIITKENYAIYSLFEELIEEVKQAKIFMPHTKELEEQEDETSLNSEIKCDEWNRLYKDNYKHKMLYDGKSITWHSDDDEFSVSNYVKITKLKDTIILEFTRPPLTEGKFPFVRFGSISIRFRNSGSTYDPFNIIFMRMYNKLQEYDPTYHQIHLEEITYQKKLTRILKKNEN